ncbi:MAG: cytochrome b/b6 domain-containing protein [Myxococcota bacterium]
MLHVTMASYGLLFRGWRPSMLVNRKDFADAVQNIRYYVGITDRPAQCDRFDYKQKFEYWGVVMGGFLMVGTGWLLWFPAKAFVLLPFLPGQLIPAAKVAHSSEALMAFLIIVIWHIYNVVFSPEVFPLDSAIFTGKVSRERMHHEHPLELLRIEAAEKAMAAAATTEHQGAEHPLQP